MVHVDRGQVPVPSVLVATDGKAAKERAENEELVRRGNFEQLTFRAYNDVTVVDALRALFKGKCAYCESRYVAQQPGDVEHFRPKAKVAFKDSSGKVNYKLGYYWLAADWSNLLPSCADCNRPRNHEIKGGVGKRVLGKANWFPVEPESRRARKPASVAGEPCLLLDPCRNDPGEHLTFDDDGEVRALTPNRTVSRMGEATIQLCALARLELTQERHRQGRYVLREINRLLRALAAGNSDDIAESIEALSEMIDPSAPYSAYARTLVARHLGPRRAELGL